MSAKCIGFILESKVGFNAFFCSTTVESLTGCISVFTISMLMIDLPNELKDY
jgi:hypothetical protein